MTLKSLVVDTADEVFSQHFFVFAVVLASLSQLSQLDKYCHHLADGKFSLVQMKIQFSGSFIFHILPQLIGI